MQIYLRDLNAGMVAAWQKIFAGCGDVHISHGDVFAPGEHMRVDAIVSPANALGYMDGGIDYVYSMFFGWGMSEELRRIIYTKHFGELLVGDAEVVDIRNTYSKTPIPYLISAPTMRVPENVADTVNAYLAFRAVLRKAKEHKFESILCPGLGTAVGEMPYNVCAIQMYEAYRYKDEAKCYDVLGNAWTRHHMLKNPQAYEMAIQAGQ